MRAFIALGGNLGDVEETFRSALSLLDGSPGVGVKAASTNHGTTPVGRRAGETFLNAAAELETTYEPQELLELLHEVEDRHARTREVRWGPRTLVLDLLLHGAAVVETERLVVPHPALWYRRFVLDPLVEIAADVVHPVKRVPVGELHERLLARPLTFGVLGGDEDVRERLLRELRGRFADAPVSFESGRRAATIVAWLGLDEDGARLEDLPLVARLDTSWVADPFEFLEGVVTAALG